MATNHSKGDPLRNPQVDYERSDLSPSGILWFLIGLFICGVFIELVIWGMFHFMARSEILFVQGPKTPMTAQNSKDDTNSRSVLQNTAGVNMNVFPYPRLQTYDAGEMGQFLNSEQNVLDTKQPFMDSTGAVHMPISMAMQLIAERGLPVRPKSPPPEFNPQTGAGNPEILNETPGPLPPGGAGVAAATPAEHQGK
jgi:hypothetical protein